MEISGLTRELDVVEGQTLGVALWSYDNPLDRLRRDSGEDRSPYECTPDGNGSLSRSRCIHEEGSHRVVRGVNERRPSVNERRPTVWWARKRGVRGVLAPAAVLGAHVCRGTRSSHRGGGHGPKSKSCCGGPLAGRMDSR
jgi:hypothetical protein